MLYVIVFCFKATGSQGFAVDIETIRAYHLLNKDKKETYLLLKFSDDGKKVIVAEKGPAKKKAAKTYAEKSRFLTLILTYI